MHQGAPTSEALDSRRLLYLFTFSLVALLVYTTLPQAWYSSRPRLLAMKFDSSPKTDLHRKHVELSWPNRMT